MKEDHLSCCLLSGGALAEGFQARMFEFQNFERRFEVRAPDATMWARSGARGLMELLLAGMYLSVGREDQV